MPTAIESFGEFLAFWQAALRSETDPEKKDTSEYWESWLNKLGRDRKDEWLQNFHSVSEDHPNAILDSTAACGAGPGTATVSEDDQNAILDLLKKTHASPNRRPLLPLLLRMLGTDPFSEWAALRACVGGLESGVFCTGLHGQAGSWDYREDLVRVCAIPIPNDGAESEAAFNFNCNIYDILPPIVDNVRTILSDYLRSGWSSFVLLLKSNWRGFNHKGVRRIRWGLVAFDFLPLLLLAVCIWMYSFGHAKPAELPQLAFGCLLCIVGMLLGAAILGFWGWWRARQVAKSWGNTLGETKLCVCFLPLQHKVLGESFCLSFAYSAMMAISAKSGVTGGKSRHGIWWHIVNGLHAHNQDSCATGGLLMLERDFDHGCQVIVSAVGGFAEKVGAVLDGKMKWFHAPKQPGAFLPKRRNARSISEFWRNQQPEMCREDEKRQGRPRWPLRLTRNASLSDALLNFAGMRTKAWGLRPIGVVGLFAIGCWAAHDCVLLNRPVFVNASDISVSAPVVNPGGELNPGGEIVSAIIALSTNVVEPQRCVATLAMHQYPKGESGPFEWNSANKNWQAGITGPRSKVAERPESVRMQYRRRFLIWEFPLGTAWEGPPRFINTAHDSRGRIFFQTE